MISTNTLSRHDCRESARIAPGLAPVRVDYRGINGSTDGIVTRKDDAQNAPKPDAPLQSTGRMVTAMLHAGVLAGIVGLVLWYVLQIPSFWDPTRNASVSIVAPSLIEVRSPIEGVFIAAADLLNGTFVKAGQVLGFIEAPQLQAKIDATERQIQVLQRRKLLLEKPAAAVEQSQFQSNLDREFRECVEKIVAAQSELERLRTIRQELVVVSPVSGRIQFGVTGSKAVATNDALAQIWPEDGDLLVEIRAPLEVIHRLVREDRVEAHFSTSEGEIAVTARPIAASLRISSEELPTGNEKQLWGFLQCRPDSLPAIVSYPGHIGTL